MAQQMAMYDQGCKLIVSARPPSRPDKLNNTFQQDAGQNTLWSRGRVSDINLL